MSSRAVDETLQLLKVELSAVQMRMEMERAKYQEAKSKMERSEIVATYLLPEWKQREADLLKKIRAQEEKE